MSKRFIQIGLLVLAAPFTSLATTDVLSFDIFPLSGFTNQAHAANSADYDQLVIEWQAAQKKLSDIIKASEDLKSANATAKADISSQKGKIKSAEQALNNALVALAEAEETLTTAENSQDDPKGRELSSKLSERQSQLDAALLATDAIKQEITTTEAEFQRANSTVKQLKNAVTAADASAKAAQVVADAAISAQKAIAEINGEGSETSSDLLESGFVKEANQQAKATLKSAAVARNALETTEVRLANVTSELTEKQETLASANKSVETAYANFANADKAYKEHDAKQKIRIQQIQAEIKAAKASLGKSQQTLTQAEQTLQQENSKLNDYETTLSTGADMQKSLDADIQTARASFDKLEGKLRRAQRARSERNAVILATLNANLHDRLRAATSTKTSVPQVYNRFMMPSETLFQTGNARFSNNGQNRINNIATLLDEVPNRIPKGVDWVLRVDGHADAETKSWELAQSRALSVVQHLIKNSSIPSERLSANAFGQFKTLETGEDFSKIAENGWIEIILTTR
ncbi:OmpA family protein [Amylibacter sp. SFDW26]|uniref:OmpA family protein n=1 Tax=Amylibacter sp. SFDW26 TaxID=2652722 RepID=UPI001261FCF0|nr:OmpA family protein [Amylibacter sp. SFDW26]KAB7610042.1 OmpA family protein [Amylibacter sp. SFDW26]